MAFVLNRAVRLRLFWPALLLILLAACSTNPSAPSHSTVQKPAPTVSPTITGPTTAGLQNCRPASPIDNSSVGPEIQGTASNAELWALLQSYTVPPKAQVDVKIVWRMTGSGDFTIVAFGPHGIKISPSEGPEAHTGSNWNRPGDEWGTVFIFPAIGCWDIHATRDKSSGDVWLKIVG